MRYSVLFLLAAFAALPAIQMCSPACAQVGTSVLVAPNKVAAEAEHVRAAPGKIDLKTISDGVDFGRATVITPRTISTTYLVRPEHGPTMGRSLHIHIGPTGHYFGSAKYWREGRSSKPVRLGGSLRQTRRTIGGDLYVDDENDGGTSSEATIEADFLPTRPPGWARPRLLVENWAGM